MLANVFASKGGIMLGVEAALLLTLLLLIAALWSGYPVGLSLGGTGVLSLSLVACCPKSAFLIQDWLSAWTSPCSAAWALWQTAWQTAFWRWYRNNFSGDPIIRFDGIDPSVERCGRTAV